MSSFFRAFSFVFSLICLLIAVGLFLSFENTARAEDGKSEQGRCPEWPSEMPDLPDGRLVTLIYNSNSWGNYNPCKVCGGKKLGGLSKRATLFNALKRCHDGKELFFLAGPYEISGPVAGTVPESDKASDISQAYNLLDYGLMALDQESARWLETNQAAIPSSAVLLGRTATSRLLRFPKVTLGVVLLPVLEQGQKPWEGQMLHDLETLCAALRKEADVLIAVSAWGDKTEAAFLENAPALFDLLLGGGTGFPGVNRFSGRDRTLWLRPPAMGKSVLAINIMDLPSKKAVGDKSLADVFEVVHLMVGESLPDDPALKELLQ